MNSRAGSFYRISKHACELLLEEYYKIYNLNYTILRFGTLFGPRSDKSNSVYYYLENALKDNFISAIGNGEEVREYIDVRDAASVCQKAILDEYNNDALIVTGNHRIKLIDLLEMINEILNNSVKIKYGEENQLIINLLPYSFTPRPGKKIVMETFRDLGPRPC